MSPPITRNFAIFLASLTFLVLATPFANQEGWLGWGASLVGAAAALAILGLMVMATVRSVKEWRDGDFD